MVPHRGTIRPVAVPRDRDDVAQSVCVPATDLDRDLETAGLEKVLAAGRLRIDVELKRRQVVAGHVDVQEIDVPRRAGMHGGHGERRARPRPRQRKVDRSRVLRTSRSQLGHHHDHVVGRLLSRPVRNSQPDVCRVESSRRPDDDLVVSSSVETELELGSAPRRDDEIAEQRVGDGSDRADGDGDGSPGVDRGAEDGGELSWNQAGRAQGRRSQYSGRLRSDRSNRAYAWAGSGVVSSALAS